MYNNQIMKTCNEMLINNTNKLIILSQLSNYYHCWWWCCIFNLIDEILLSIINNLYQYYD